MSDLPWFRLYTDMVDNEKIRLLAFEDRWHFVAILCCKQQGVLKNKDNLLERKLAVKLGLQLRELDEVKRRLMEVDLINDEWEPNGWAEHQCKSDSSTERTRKYREQQKNKTGNVTGTSQERHSDALDIDKEEDKETEEDKELDKTAKPLNTKQLLAKYGIEGQLATDFINHRKTKKAAITETAINGFWREACKAGISVPEAVQESIERGWTGFKADWYFNATNGNQSKADAINARNKAVLDEWLAEQGGNHVSH